MATQHQSISIKKENDLRDTVKKRKETPPRLSRFNLQLPIPRDDIVVQQMAESNASHRSETKVLHLVSDPSLPFEFSPSVLVNSSSSSSSFLASSLAAFN